MNDEKNKKEENIQNLKKTESKQKSVEKYIK